MPIYDQTSDSIHAVYVESKDADLFLLEVDQYLNQYPETEHIDICLHDLNGHLRGKRIDIKSLRSLAKGCYFPLSIYAMSLEGKVIEESGLGKYIGEPDSLCLPILGSLRPCANQSEKHAQLYLTMKSENGSDCEFEPRNILKKILLTLNQMNYFPVMAGEVEFYLYANQSNTEYKLGQTQSFDVDAPHNYQTVLEGIEIEAKKQNIAVTAIVAESSSGQFEINLQHSSDILKLCDDILAVKRIVKHIAIMNGLNASFMAKPNMLSAGSGLHFHMSLLNQLQHNIFGTDERKQPNQCMAQIIASLIQLMPAAMAILAPNINSFRRFQFAQHVPLEANWGINNRNVAIRLPCADQENYRLEYRVAGADANPYLCISIILIGVLHGLTHTALKLPKAAHEIKPHDARIFLPNHQIDALKLFENNAILKQYLGASFVQLWSACKKYEYQLVANKITDLELQWGL
ncbi:glutamine synthetase family protein [Acinetobacter sp. ANC 4648]|uniref:glutamine synthetase family protein n=1 Tax=Acinetobacter sp. ANC 4648 TaxID=1977875 RepID=UPI001D1777AE|nr:glutamine synthetase family protein [Acinetobacter sp. ANC 4648]